ncbi:ring-cleaving dioxygenase [Oharaeibacter diazotrophicus]|uniref:Glyoxalase family protein n=2 Tax=Oharaeibacter diazotrophicus TaxID=1920512 RepID=A0A4R6RIR4_9HYPH|nr:ring-cleaving dioxygenase [Oharaeibacter diazotrophicus]TDP86419.1 glyoxalase family protein [Oharaeibacter diazotrophicus]BBE71638.1 putative ring-cleaving dioxygenase MhqE [Pleomorphomonas sp. SM30]GLS78403.1 diguanylate cyclase [Oharaeibacter diazotrophicus]
MSGIHHVTAIASAARANIDFYTRVLGLRLVKRTVNFDDPGTWHFYFGDRDGAPGTLFTTFPWAHARAGRLGVGEVQETVFAVPEGAIGFWTHRLLAAGATVEDPASVFGARRLAFRDPDGMRLALAATPAAGDGAWTTAEIGVDEAIRGIAGVTLLVADAAPTAAVLTGALGFSAAGTEGAAARFVVPGATTGGIVDVRAVGGFPRGALGKGSVHHVAFRAADDAEQAAIVDRLAAEFGIHATEQKDRNYFRSVYFREPGGTIFEIATDAPGFAVDETPDALGTALKLPARYESRRAEIAAALPTIA